MPFSTSCAADVRGDCCRMTCRRGGCVTTPLPSGAKTGSGDSSTTTCAKPCAGSAKKKPTALRSSTRRVLKWLEPVLHFATPEASWKLAGGRASLASEHHRIARTKNMRPGGCARNPPAASCTPSGVRSSCGCDPVVFARASLDHRLISFVPPGRMRSPPPPVREAAHSPRDGVVRGAWRFFIRGFMACKFMQPPGVGDC